MYDELVKRLRNCAELHGECALCLYEGNGCDTMPETPLVQAADAIEELQGKAKVLEKLADKWCEAVPKWIPVTERLPEINKYVLGCFKDGSMTAVCFFDRDEHMTFWRACTDEGWEADCDSEPTHWMPLPEPDPVNHPQHYTRGGIECIDAIAAAVQDLPGKEAWLVGQIIKYVWRYKWKNGAEDLEKARFYLDRLIGEVKA